MRIASVTLVIAAVVGLTVALAQSSESEQPRRVRVGQRAIAEGLDLDLDEGSAIKIAEIVLVRVYGERVLGERPWRVTKNENVFKIAGTLKRGRVGGVASIEIRATNAEVLLVTHSK